MNMDSQYFIMGRYYAHSANRDGLKHGLVEHLMSVARGAAEFAGKFGAGELEERIAESVAKLFESE